MFRTATYSDVELLNRIFWEQIARDGSYISHGELQMGLVAPDGGPAADRRARWERYIRRMIGGADSAVLIMERGGAPVGFTALDMVRGGEVEYGVICDIIVLPEFRGGGEGSQMLEKGKEWLSRRGAVDIYLESGVGNHAAHSFFEGRDFKIVSHVFKLSGI